MRRPKDYTDAQADHRLAMVFGVLASVLPFPVAVRQAEARVKTFPDFWLQYLGMHCPAHLHPKAMRVDLPQLTPYQQKWQALLGPVFAQVSADKQSIITLCLQHWLDRSGQPPIV